VLQAAIVDQRVGRDARADAGREDRSAAVAGAARGRHEQHAQRQPGAAHLGSAAAI